MEMMDMGHKMDKTEAQPISEDKMMYPSLHVSHKMPAELQDKDVGDMCRLEVIGKIVSKSVGEYGSTMDVEVHKMGYLGKAGQHTKEEKMAMSEEERDKANHDEIMNKEGKKDEPEETE